MYRVLRNGKPAWEAASCGIGFLATRRGVPERQLVDFAIGLCGCFDHRGAPGHGAGLQTDIPWPLLIDRFPDHAKLIAQRDCALGMFFLPQDAQLRQKCVQTIHHLATVAGCELVEWADVPVDTSAVPSGSNAYRTLPRVRQALFQRGPGMSEDEWFVCRFLLRLAIDEQVSAFAGDDFAVASLSNRTVVYKGLVELSKIAKLYPDLRDPHFASRYVLFHSRYSTNTTTAWRRAQPFWALAHNGEINTIEGNRAWMQAIGQDLIRNLGEKHPSQRELSEMVRSIVSPHGSDSAALDDFLIALVAGGMSVPSSILALMPEALSVIQEGDPLRNFYRAMKVFLGACDGPAAIVACDGSTAVAHLDRNGLRPLWVEVTDDYAVAASELTGTTDTGNLQDQRILGPGGTFMVNLDNGQTAFDEEAHQTIAASPHPRVEDRLFACEAELAYEEREVDKEALLRQQIAFGMGSEDIDVVLEPMLQDGKPAIGSMGDDTPVAAMLDNQPRRLEGYFKLRFAQETSPPVDPIRDALVFDTSVILGDRRGLWHDSSGPLYRFDDRILNTKEYDWLTLQPDVAIIDLTFPANEGAEGLERHLHQVVEHVLEASQWASVIILDDQKVDQDRAAIPALRALSHAHTTLVDMGLRQRAALVAHAGIWDIQHAALLITFGADAVCPWLGNLTANGQEENYIKALRSGFREAMSMMGITPSSAYCGARLAEAVGLDFDLLAEEFGEVPGHIEGIGRETLDKEWLSFHDQAYKTDPCLEDFGEFRHSKTGRPHFNNAHIVRSIQLASGYARKIHDTEPGSKDAYDTYAELVNAREPITLLDCLAVRKAADPIPIEEVDPIEDIVWRFLAPGMSEGALSEPAHRSVARGMNILHRYCRFIQTVKSKLAPPGVGPIANSGEGGFDKTRVGTSDANQSIQYAGGRFTITPHTAATAREAEIKFAQGAKPGKGGQLPGKKVDQLVAHRRGCRPGYELVSPPINHNLYSIEDVKLMLESWRHLNPDVWCSLKYVATHGVDLVALGGVNAGATRLHFSDASGGTGAAKRVDQKSAGIPVVAKLPDVQDALMEEGVRQKVELSVDGGVQTGEQALKLMLLGADRVGFGTSLLMAVGCSMLRKCHIAGPDPRDPSGKRRLGCAPGVATQDPALVSKFKGNGKHVARMLYFLAHEIREKMAESGIKSLNQMVGRRGLLEVRTDLQGKAALLDLSPLVSPLAVAPQPREDVSQKADHTPKRRTNELDAVEAALQGTDSLVQGALTNEARAIGVQAAGMIARANGDQGLEEGSIRFENTGAAGHFYAAYSLPGMSFKLEGLAADSVFTAAYGGEIIITPPKGQTHLTVVGNTFAYGARGGRAFIAGSGGNRFGICLRQNHEGTGPTVVVEGVEANAFQYMTGGTALVLGTTGFNLGAGMTGGVIYLLEPDETRLNTDYVGAFELDDEDQTLVQQLLEEHIEKTGSITAERLLKGFDPSRYRRIETIRLPEPLD